MKKNEMKLIFDQRNLPAEQFEACITVVEAFEAFLLPSGTTIETASMTALGAFVDSLVRSGRATIGNFIGLMRYVHMVGRHDLYIQLTRYTGPDGVIETILDRVEKKLGKEAREEILSGLSIPALGTPPQAYPAFTGQFMKRIKKTCPKARLGEVMAGNNHRIPETSLAQEKELYNTAPSFESYLADLHQRQIAILQKYCEAKKVWYEQEITQEVVDFVAKNQEIQSYVLKDNKLYTTKIPYDAKHFVGETDPLKRRYYACHCPFVRESILSGKPKIDPDWCLCSAGYSKFQFEVMFGKDLPVKCLNNPLLGDDFCRFEIDLSGVDHK